VEKVAKEGSEAGEVEGGREGGREEGGLITSKEALARQRGVNGEGEGARPQKR